MGLFDGKVALVTGGSSGIGRATAIAFAHEGANVVLTYHRNRLGGHETVQLIEEHDGHAICLQTDVANAAEVLALVEATISTFGRLDYAFNNSGVPSTAKFAADVDEQEWDRIIDVNLRGVWLCMKYEIPHLIKQGGGVIVNNSSLAGLTSASQNPAYTSSKHGVIGLSKSAAQAYRKAGVRINMVCPGWIWTPMVETALNRRGPVMKARMEQFKAEGLVGEPVHIANAVTWLCSDAAAFVTGHALVVDGGFGLERFPGQ
jgi:NAD(P)-dependent dehydrogenase (short-subunit alcohol dehydrogenase family)